MTNDKWGDENKYMSFINYLELQVLNEYDIACFYLVICCQLHFWEFLAWRFIDHVYYIGVGASICFNIFSRMNYKWIYY